MIITMLLNLIIMVLNLIISLIPDITFDFNIGGYIAPLANFFGYVDSFVSLNVIVFCISLILLVDNYTLIFRLINWLWEKIPFIN